MATVLEGALQQQLIDRRQKLQSASAIVPENVDLARLLRDVDAALERIDAGTYGLCAVCHDPVESERLIADPLCEYCLDHLTTPQKKALEEDLELAGRIQLGLLPEQLSLRAGWTVAYHYEALGPVSGDYCDLISGKDNTLYFMLGDVSGKGVAASMLMAHLHGMFRSLIPIGLPLNELMERASRLFCESTLPSHFATLVCGRASSTGQVELCNAGHLPPLWRHGAEVRRIDATGLPIGLFCDQRYTVSRIQLGPGDSLLLFTDGISEAHNGEGHEYGMDRLSRVLVENRMLQPREMIESYLKDLKAFRSAVPKADDVTLMAIHRSTGPSLTNLSEAEFIQ